MYNILSCSGWEAGGYFTFGGCMKARLAFVLLFFIIAIIRKWVGEEMGIPFSFLFGLLGGFLGYIILISILGNVAWAFGAGLITSCVLGFGSGMLGLGGEE